MAETIKIGGELESTATGNKVTDASAVKDKAKGNKSQAEFNSDVVRHENEINGSNGLDSRLRTVEELAEISVGGGDIGIGTAADFESDDPSDLAKVPTVGAILGGLNDGIYDVSKRNPTAGPNSDGKFTLDYILDNANTLIPTGWRHGGMTISFVHTSDNKYVQYMYNGTATTGTPNPFLDTANWDKINMEEEVTQLEEKTKKVDVIDFEESDGGIVIEDDNENVVAKFNGAGGDIKNLKSNGETVVVLSDLQSRDNSIGFLEEKTDNIENNVAADNEEELILETNNSEHLCSFKRGREFTENPNGIAIDDDDDNRVFEVTPEGVRAKSFMSIDGNVLISSPIYLSPSGNDNNSGSIDSPRLSIQKAINDGYRNIFLAAGRYTGQQVVIDGIDGISIICNSDQTETTIYDSHFRRKHAQIDNSIDISDLAEYNSIYKAALSVSESHSFYKVFISQELPIVYAGSDYLGVGDTYNAILWEMTKDVLTCKKVVPVLTVEECAQTQGTFTYDGDYIYINPYDGSIINKTYKRLEKDNTTDIGLTITNCSNVYIEGVDVVFFPKNNFYTEGVKNATVRDFVSSFTCYQSANHIISSDIDFFDSISAHAANDGWGVSSFGVCSLYNCYGIHCYDDGVSHHDGAKGVVDGGQWIYNGKGGVLPSYGSDVSVKNVYSSHNRFGLYYAADTQAPRITSKQMFAINCILVNNTDKDCKISNYNVILANSTFETLDVLDNSTTSLVEYNNNHLQ